MSIVAAVLLRGYIGFALYGLFSPSDDPQRSMADGFIIFRMLQSLTGALFVGLGIRLAVPESR